jgi:hypothetical protein
MSAIRISMVASLAAAAALFLGGGAVGASAPTPLPDLLLETLDGAAVHGNAEFPTHGKWLIVYVQSSCRPCDTLLNSVKIKDDPSVPANMVVVVGGGASEARAIRNQMPDLAGAHWYTDHPHNAWGALNIAGVPMVFGVKDRTIQWSLTGVPPRGGNLKSILGSWVTE